MLWYDWGQIHTLMWQSNWCEIHTLMQQCDWCKQHATIYANTEFDFFFLIQKKVTKKKSPRKSQSLILPSPKKLTVKSSPWGRHSKTILVPGGAGNKTSQSSKIQMPGEKGCWFKLWTDRQISKKNTLARWLISNGIGLSGVLFSL